VVEKPRIYFAIENFYPLIGGAETQTLAQCRNLIERGYEATVVTYRYDKKWSQHEVIDGLPIIRVAGAFMGNRAATLLASRDPSTGKDRNKLAKFFRKFATLMAMLLMTWTLWHHRRDFDILHVCEFSKLALPTALICRLTGKAMIIVVISSGSGAVGGSANEAKLIVGPLDPEAPFLKVEARTLVGGDLEGLERAGKFLSQVTQSLLQSTNAVVIVLSSRMKKYVESHNYKMKMALIPNGVDTVRFQPLKVETTANERAQIAVCVSQMRYEKGIDVLLQAWNIVHRELPQARLILVGRGAIQTQLQEMAEALDIADSVEFVGLQKDVPSQLHRGTVAVLPSRWEGLSNALLEQMACGLACVATRVSGSEDVIQHGINGLLVESEDYQGIAQALLTLLRDPVLAVKYGQAARATIEKNYVLEHITDKYIELYQQIAGHRSLQIPEQHTQTPIASSR
jgi:glycosyltransferase involved in cell wall biosynthesis